MTNLELLINIGKNLQLSSKEKSILIDLDNINRQSIKFWNEEIKEINNENLIFLFKGIVFVEKELCWNGGSVAGGIWIYKEIDFRNLDNDYNIANWTFANTNNDYLPFGSKNYGAKNIIEYNNRKWNISKSREIEKFLKERNKLNRNINGLEQTIIRQQKAINDLKYRNDLLKKTNIEIAELIVSDDSKSIYFYYAEIERIIQDEKINIKLIERILEKFNGNEKRNLKILKIKIAERINKSQQ